MPIIDDASQTVQRFSSYIKELVELFRKFDITGPRATRSLWIAVRNSQFRNEWKRIWLKIAEHEGGKLSLTTVLAIIGAVSGGAGIAAFGGAIGVPLAVLLGLVGYFVGNEMDAKGLVRRLRESLTSSNEPTPLMAQTTEDVEELAELITTLLARCEQDEQLVRALQEETLKLEKQNGELRANISVVSSRCDKAESVAREAQDRTALILQELSDLRGSVPILQSQLTSLKQKIKHLVWSGATVGAVMAIAVVWLFVRK